MLVCVNTERGTITVYGNTVITLPLTQAMKLRSLLLGRTVEYVREIVEASGEEVLELVADLTRDAQVAAASRHVEIEDDNRLWLHATGSGFLNIAGIMKFDGPNDFKLMEKVGFDIAERHPQIKSLMDRKLLEIVNTEQMKSIKKRNADKDRERDRGVNSLIVDLRPGQKIEHMDLRNISASVSGEGYVDPNRPRIDVDSSQPDSDFVPEEVAIARKMGWGRPDDDGEGTST